MIKQEIMVDDYIKSLENNQQRFKSDAHNMYREVVNKIAVSSDDDKILERVCKKEFPVYK